MVHLYWLVTDMLQKASHEASTLLTILLTCLYVQSNTTWVHVFWALIQLYIAVEDALGIFICTYFEVRHFAAHFLLKYMLELHFRSNFWGFCIAWWNTTDRQQSSLWIPLCCVNDSVYMFCLTEHIHTVINLHKGMVSTEMTVLTTSSSLLHLYYVSESLRFSWWVSVGQCQEIPVFCLVTYTGGWTFGICIFL